VLAAVARLQAHIYAHEAQLAEHAEEIRAHRSDWPNGPPTRRARSGTLFCSSSGGP
jgi:hypothetical protein